jgi:hypothetical protein
LIKIEWIKEPTRFSVYTWKPGYSWILRQSFINYKGKMTEIRLRSIDAAAIMIVLEESQSYEELGNRPAYAIKKIYAGYFSMRVKILSPCINKPLKYKTFDFETQYYKTTPFTPAYHSTAKQMSIAFEKMINNFRSLRAQMSGVAQIQQKATNYHKMLEQFKIAAVDMVNKMHDFKNTSLTKLKNTQLNEYLKNDSDGQVFKKNLAGKYKGQPKLGEKSNPAIDCLSLKRIVPNSLSGFYYIKPSCAPKALRVFCDFTIYGEAVDIHIFNDNSKVPNPDLSYLKIDDFMSIRYQCAKLGMYPIEIQNREMIQRIHNVLSAIGYDLSQPKGVPLGYDYTCKTNKCNKVINSLNDHLSKPIMTFFANPNYQDNTIVKGGPFVGFGFSRDPFTQISFTRDTPMSALICSTNHFKTDVTDTSVQNITCDMNVMNNGNRFKLGSQVVVVCPQGCMNSQAKIFGNGFYHGASSICRAAIHTEAIVLTGGKIIVRIHPPSATNYVGNFSGGIQSNDRPVGDTVNSFSVIKYNDQCPIDMFSNLKPEEKQLLEAMKQTSFMEMGMQMQTSNAIEEFMQKANQQPINLNSEEFKGIDPEDMRRMYQKIREVPNGIESISQMTNNNENVNDQFITPEIGDSMINQSEAISGDSYNNSDSMDGSGSHEGLLNDEVNIMGDSNMDLAVIDKESHHENFNGSEVYSPEPHNYDQMNPEGLGENLRPDSSEIPLENNYSNQSNPDSMMNMDPEKMDLSNVYDMSSGDASNNYTPTQSADSMVSNTEQFNPTDISQANSIEQGINNPTENYNFKQNNDPINSPTTEAQEAQYTDSSQDQNVDTSHLDNMVDELAKSRGVVGMAATNIGI